MVGGLDLCDCTLERVYRDTDPHLVRLKNHLQQGLKTPLKFLDAASHWLKKQL